MTKIRASSLRLMLPLDNKGGFVRETVLSRHRNNYPKVTPDQVDYMDVSPMQAGLDLGGFGAFPGA